ncbi:SDR family oxidoreductase [Sporosarcina sp. 179-K 3D1 HS]|uniref:SDR family oxidoreductase n=1 Tax=Sporosarcina sp. 179-K 3D1 HS TaxID=3232169 RepID=UPI0039A31F79
MRTHFFTGFPGFIATQLIKGLIRQQEVEAVYAVVQPEQVERAEKQIDAIMEELEVEIPFDLFIGDITQPDLGLDAMAKAALKKQPLVVWHLAAIYDLAVDVESAWRVNVEGTRLVNEFVLGHPSIVRYMYFSTAYVAGKREGVLLETELIRPDAFKNHYEETKFEAEVLVEALKPLVPVTIIRPGIVRGHSRTGETIKFDGPYFFMNMIDRLRWLPVIPYVGRTEARINVVPIDYIIDASIYLSRLRGAARTTVHLTDPSPHPIEEVYRAMVIELTGKRPRGRFPRPLAEKSLTSIRLQRRLGVEVETLDYLTWNAVFDTTNAERLLEGSGIQCVDFIQSIPAMVSFYNKHKHNQGFHIKIG